MKKAIMGGVLMVALCAACSREKSGPPPGLEIPKGMSIEQKIQPFEVQAMQRALHEISLPKYDHSPEYTAKYGDELSPEQKQVLLEPSKQLIRSTGITEDEFARILQTGTDAIINKAMDILISKTSQTFAK